MRKMRPLPTRVVLTDSARQANKLIRQNPVDMAKQQIEELKQQLVSCLQEHDTDPAHIIEDKGYYKRLTTAAAARSEKLAWHIYYCEDQLRRLADPTYTVAGYTGRNSNRRLGGSKTKVPNAGRKSGFLLSFSNNARDADV